MHSDVARRENRIYRNGPTMTAILSSVSLLRRARAPLAALLTLVAAAGCGGSEPQAGHPIAGATQGPVPTNDNGPPDDMPITEAPTPPKATGNPLKGIKMWVDPESLAALRAKALKSTKPEDAKLLEDKIAKYPQALWLGDWNKNIYRKVNFVVAQADADHAVPIFIAYNVPGRDCGQYSAGGVKTDDDYKRWIRKVAAGIGDKSAVIVLEPDSLGLLDKENCLTPPQQEARLNLIHDAVKVLRQNPKTIVYIDGGHSKWQPADVMADRLKRAGVLDANGFALNTSNYRPNDELIPYGKKISEKLGGVHFVIDTSRNGVKPDNEEWCNPPNRKIGKPPTTETGDDVIDGFLWLKRPGESDGDCGRKEPKAGEFWDDRAIDLAK